jgi:hypothetical protein
MLGSLSERSMEVSAITFFPRHTRLTVRFRHHLYSSQIPRLATTLLDVLPGLRQHMCHNRNGLPFVQELKDTELGHVFEHVMLEILRRRGLETRGQTTWNWHRDPLGTYQVTISSGKRLALKEAVLISQALFTNTLLGPVLQVHLPKPAARPPATSLPLSIRHRSPERLLFSAKTQTPEPARE